MEATKSCRIKSDPAALSLRTDSLLVLNKHALDCAMLRRACIVNPHFLPSSQRCSDNFARTVDDSRGSAERETTGPCSPLTTMVFPGS